MIHALLAAAAGLAAAVDWVAVGRRMKTIEYGAKPAVVILLAGSVATAEEIPQRIRPWLIAALLLSAAGDVFLMLPRDLFLPGLGAFFVAHLVYAAGFGAGGDAAAAALPGGAAAVLIAATALRRVLASLPSSAPPLLRISVGAYAVAVTAMVAAAFYTGRPLVAAGGALFFLSDLLIAWNRFVTPLPWAPVVIIVTYHLGQGGLTLGWMVAP